MVPRKNSHCSWCGTAFTEGQPWPRTCGGCQRISYLNPLPVAVLLLPVDDGLICIRRGIEPGKGKLALPGGFVELRETWQEAATREVREETGITIDPGEVQDFLVLSSTDDGVLLVFGLARERTLASLPAFQPTNETTERGVLYEPAELAFPLHTQAVRAYFEGRAPGLLLRTM